MPMHVPFPYFYPPNGSKAHHFPASLPTTSNDAKTSARRSTTSPENSSSPINFSENLRRSRSMSNEEKIRDQPDDENVEVD